MARLGKAGSATRSRKVWLSVSCDDIDAVERFDFLHRQNVWPQRRNVLGLSPKPADPTVPRY